MNTISYTE